MPRPDRSDALDYVVVLMFENRSGIRVPAIAISRWIPECTVITGHYRHTSLIRTLRERWSH
jgi:Phosphoesterase family